MREVYGLIPYSNTTSEIILLHFISTMQQVKVEFKETSWI